METKWHVFRIINKVNPSKTDKMKIRNIILPLFAIFILSGCKKDQSEDPYTNKKIMEDNAHAVLYFHTVFREAENAWAFINSKEYVEGEYPDPANTSTTYKIMTYSKTLKKVTIEYNAWKSGGHLLIGKIHVEFSEKSYRTKDQVANVMLTDFSINGQNVVGQSSIRYNKVENSDNDHYTYTLKEGAAIHEVGSSKPVLISGAIASGQYERIEGNEKLTQDDDVWVYSGEMKGMLREDQNLKYTNTVISKYMGEDGNEKDGRIYFTMDCVTAQQGVSQIKVSGRPDTDIIYGYLCSDIDYLSVEKVY